MLESLPKNFCVFNLKDNQADFKAKIALTKMARLQSATIDSDKQLCRVNLTLKRIAGFDYSLSGSLETELALVCQRCLGAVNFKLQHELDLQLSTVENELTDVLLDEMGNLSLLDVIEDELLLSLPLIAKHEDVAQCGLENDSLVKYLRHDESKGSQQVNPSQQQSAKNQSAKNPFAILKDLKNKI